MCRYLQHLNVVLLRIQASLHAAPKPLDTEERLMCKGPMGNLLPANVSSVRQPLGPHRPPAPCSSDPFLLFMFLRSDTRWLVMLGREGLRVSGELLRPALVSPISGRSFIAKRSCVGQLTPRTTNFAYIPINMKPRLRLWRRLHPAEAQRHSWSSEFARARRLRILSKVGAYGIRGTLLGSLLHGNPTVWGSIFRGPYFHTPPPSNRYRVPSRDSSKMGSFLGLRKCATSAECTHLCRMIDPHPNSFQGLWTMWPQ